MMTSAFQNFLYAVSLVYAVSVLAEALGGVIEHVEGHEAEHGPECPVCAELEGWGDV